MANLMERWFETKTPSLYSDFSGLQESMDRLMNEIWNLRKTNGMKEFGFAPSCEIADDEKNYVMKFDLPGVTKEQVKVETDNDQITIRAERKEEKKHEDKKKYLSEIYYGSYVRSFSLPEPIDEKKIDAKFENGVLTVTVPKTTALKTKQIPVQ